MTRFEFLRNTFRRIVTANSHLTRNQAEKMENPVQIAFPCTGFFDAFIAF
jgi:hypothetical protein